MKIEVGDYVRTKTGLEGIGVITEIDGLAIMAKFKNYYMKSSACNYKCSNSDIKKIIEVGDYIDGHEVTYIDNDLIQVDSAGWLYYDGNLGMMCHEKYEEDIKRIVTKEQFASVMYEVNK